MRKKLVIEGHTLTLDTETATFLDERSFLQYGNPSGYEERLYRTGRGVYFVWGQGGATSPYPEPALRLVTEKQAENFKMLIPLDSPMSQRTPAWAPIKLVALDMDGTLLTTDKRILPSTLEAIRAAQAMGCAVALCTGRSPEMISVYEEQLSDLRYAICNSGATVLDRSEGTLAGNTLYEKGFSAEVLSQIVAQVREGDYVFEIFADNSSYMDEGCMDQLDSHNLGVYKPLFKKHAHFVPNVLDWVEEGHTRIVKFNVHTTSVEERNRLRSVFADFPVTMANTEKTALELSPEGVSKATGLYALCENLDIEPVHTMAVGDSGNDVEVLRAAGLGVAMGNADMETLAASQVQVADCDNGGIAEAFDRFVL